MWISLDPEHIAIFCAEAIGIFDSKLCFSHASQATNCLWLDDFACVRKILVECQDFLATSKIGVTLKWHMKNWFWLFCYNCRWFYRYSGDGCSYGGTCRCILLQVNECPFNALDNIKECIILTSPPLTDRFVVRWERFEFGKGCISTFNGAEKNRYNTCLLCCVTFNGLLQFVLITKIGGHIVWTNEQENHLGRFEV